MNNEILYKWVFVYNPYKQMWMTAKREHYQKLFSDINSHDVLASTDIDTLVQLIMKTNGDKVKLQELIENYQKGEEVYI